MLTATQVPASPAAFHDVDFAQSLQMRVLRTARERQALAHLRPASDGVGAEEDLGLGLEACEHQRDTLGLVLGMYRGAQPLAKIRVVPCGHDLTATERLFRKLGLAPEALEPGTWEVGRVFMRCEDRSPEMLMRFLAMSLQAYLAEADIRHFVAGAAPVTARLWRRAGFRTLLTTQGASGASYCFMRASTPEVAKALRLDERPQERALA